MVSGIDEAPSNHAYYLSDRILRRRFINAAQDACPEFIEGLVQPRKRSKKHCLRTN